MATSKESSSEWLADGVGRLLERGLTRDHRRKHGIYFSGKFWSERLRTMLPRDDYRRYFDPACGIGDLLVAIAAVRPLEASLQATIQSWKQVFFGTDTESTFHEVVWERLVSIARTRHGAKTKSDRPRFEGIHFNQADGLASEWDISEDDCIIMNPPFHMMQAPSWSSLTSGKVTAAALFLEKALRNAKVGTTIAAIVPEVIRSGTRFEKLRSLINEVCTIHHFSAEGRFSGEADIDVALLVATYCGKSNSAASGLPASLESVLGDDFEVRVGTVVPHRPKLQKKSRPYLDVAGAPTWCEVTVSRKEHYADKAFSPPFVVVKRTSSPSDKKRARATIIKGDKPVLVENHLIVLLPKRRTLKECRAAMKVLRSEDTDVWLNGELRCRHLTVKVVKKIPFSRP